MNNSTIEELNNRLFDPCLFSILIVPTKIYYKVSDNFIQEREIYIFFSCNITAKRKYLTSVFADEFVKTSDWYNFLLNLKNRGISVVLYAVIQNNESLLKTFKLAFSEIYVFISCYEAVNKLSRYYSYSYSKSILGKVKKIFLSPSVEEYEVVLNDFTEKYTNFRFVYDILEEDLKRARIYYNIDFKIRNFIFSFYFVRDITKRISVISHSKPYFSSLDDFIIPLIPNIQTLETRMFCTKNELNNVINLIYDDKKDLIISYL